ncbi:MAG: hypothetical protein ACI4U5_06480 [Bacilli bacterium]
MKSFIYDRYGYDVNVDDGSFVYKDFIFKIERVEKSEEELRVINELCHKITQETFSKVSSICVNRNNMFLTPYEDYNVVLISVEKFIVTLSDLIFFHRKYINFQFQEEPISLNDIKTRWINKTTYIREKILHSFSMSSPYYDILRKVTFYMLGYADNAIQYLEDLIIDKGEKITYLTIAHKRLRRLTSYDLCNPLNLVYDSPTRDLAELYKFHSLSKEELIDSLKYYSFSSKDIAFLLARLLYPTYLFDLLESSYEEKKDIHRHIELIYKNLPLQRNSLLYIYKELKQKYMIRPIYFLENKY